MLDYDVFVPRYAEPFIYVFAISFSLRYARFEQASPTRAMSVRWGGLFCLLIYFCQPGECRRQNKIVDGNSGLHPNYRNPLAISEDDTLVTHGSEARNCHVSTSWMRGSVLERLGRLTRLVTVDAPGTVLYRYISTPQVCYDEVVLLERGP